MMWQSVGFLCIVSACANAEWNERSRALWMSRYPEEFDNLTEGDLDSGTAQSMRKNGLRSEAMRWPDGTVPYQVIGPYTLDECKIIESAFEDYQRKTCVRFRLRNKNDKDFVSIVNTPGCHAEVGRIGGDQVLNVGEGPCASKGTVMHELMHVLGFMHEQKRYDRDDYVQVQFENLQPSKKNNFQKQDENVITSFGVLYDYESITHYSPLAFSANGKPTVMLKKKAQVNVGQREYLSIGDVEKINRMYNCTPTLIQKEISVTRLCS